MVYASCFFKKCGQITGVWRFEFLKSDKYKFKSLFDIYFFPRKQKLVQKLEIGLVYEILAEVGNDYI